MNLTKEQKIILYLIKHIRPTRIKRTLIFKLLFLADVEFYQIYREKITNYKYCMHSYGPFSKSIYEDLEYLELVNIISARKLRVIDYTECKYELTKDLGISLDRQIMMVLDEVIQLGNKLSLVNILKLVYDLPVVKAASKYGFIDFSLMDKKIEGKINNLDKYKNIIKKIKSKEFTKVTEDSTKEIIDEYYSWRDNLRRVNKEILCG